MSKLTTKARNALPASKFAGPGRMSVSPIKMTANISFNRTLRAG